MRYCPGLRDLVIVMTENRVGMPENKICLSEHLCASDERIRCDHTNQCIWNGKRDADVLNM